MKIETSILKKTLNAIASVPNTGKNTDSLSFVEISAVNKTLIIRATDLEQVVEVKIPADTEGSFRTTVHFSELKKAISKVKNPTVDVTVNAGNLLIKHKVLVSLNNPVNGSESYTQLDYTIKEADNYSTVRNLDYMINQVKYCVSTENNYYTYNGIFFDEKVLVATDGCRLAKIDSRDKLINQDEGIIVHNRTIKLFQDLLKVFSSETTDIGINEKDVIFETSDFSIVSKCLDGKFPDWSKVIPTIDCEASFVADRKDLLEVFDIFKTSTKSPSYQVIATVENDDLTFSTCEKDDYKAKVEYSLKLDKHNGGFRAGVNSSYVFDFLKNLDAEKIEIKMYGDRKPFIIKTSNKGFVGLVMPIKI